LHAEFSTPSSQASSRPLSRRVSKARWERALRVVARTRMQPPGWTPMTVAVAGRLASYMSATGGSCFPGIRTLAAELLSKTQTVSKHIRLLAAAGYVEVHKGGGRGHRTEYYALLPIDVDQAVNARARARRRAPAPQPPVDQADVAGDEGLQASAAAAAEPAAEQLAGEAQAHDDVAGDGLVVGEVLGEASAAVAVTSGDGAETVSHRQRGGEGVSQTPSCPSGNPGRPAVQTGGARHAPRTTRPARVLVPVAAVIDAIPATERQRLWIRTWRPAVEALEAALRESGATPAELAAAIDAAAPWPLRHAHYPGSALVARMPAALELLAVQRRADARARELDAAPAPAAAEVSAPASPEVARAALAAVRAEIAARPCPLHPDGCPASPQVRAPWGIVSRSSDVAAPAAPGDPEWQQAWAVLLGDQAVTVGPDGYLRPA
jgi:DNA-binding MarR family transcriptional regulator